LGSKSISLCGMADVNQLAALGPTPQTRVTTPPGVSNYDRAANRAAIFRIVRFAGSG
jgi:hypothetical protein